MDYSSMNYFYVNPSDYTEKSQLTFTGSSINLSLMLSQVVLLFVGIILSCIQRKSGILLELPHNVLLDPTSNYSTLLELPSFL